MLVDTPLLVEQGAPWSCTMCSANCPRSSNNSSSLTFMDLTLLCHLVDAQVAVDGTDSQGDLLHCADSTADVPQAARQPSLLLIGWQLPQRWTTAGTQRGKPKHPAQATVIGEAKSDMRDTFREEPIMSDAVSQNFLEFVLGGPTKTWQGRNLCTNVNLGCADVPEHSSLTLGFPPSSDFDLIGECSSLLRFVSGSLLERVSTQTLMLVTLQSHGIKLIILKDMVVHVVSVVGLKSLRCSVVHVLGEETLGTRIPSRELLQTHAKVEHGTQRRLLGS